MTGQRRRQRDKGKGRVGLREQVVSLALALATKILEKQLDEKEHRRLMDEFIEQVGNNMYEYFDQRYALALYELGEEKEKQIFY